eukprot:6190705-Pleurochrysis_carterae.AAC.2
MERTQANTSLVSGHHVRVASQTGSRVEWRSFSTLPGGGGQVSAVRARQLVRSRVPRGSPWQRLYQSVSGAAAVYAAVRYACGQCARCCFAHRNVRIIHCGRAATLLGAKVAVGSRAGGLVVQLRSSGFERRRGGRAAALKLGWILFLSMYHQQQITYHLMPLLASGATHARAGDQAMLITLFTSAIGNCSQISTSM